MERSRQRGHSFYADDDEDVANVVSDGVNSLSVSLDDIEYENGGEETEEPRGRSQSLTEDDDPFGDVDENDNDEEEQPTRSRSRSRTHLGATEKGIIPVIPGTQTDPKPRSNSIERKEKTGPLTHKEVEVLRKGLEEATTTRNIDQLREEEEEKLAAKEEEEERLGRKDSSDDEGLSAIEKAPEPARSVGAGVLESVIGTRKSVAPVPVAAVPPRRATNAAAMQQKYTAGSENTNMRRFKILLLGDSGVGKSSLILRWNEDKFSSTLVGTVGVNFKTRKVSVEGEAVSVQVWDTAGQEQFHKITTTYYKGAHAIMVVYDISDKKSLENVEYWIKNIKQHANAAVHVCLVGNKTDLRAVAAAQQEEGGSDGDGNGNDDSGCGDGDSEGRDRTRSSISEYTDEDADLDVLYGDGGGGGGVEGTVRRLQGGRRMQCIDFATGEATAERLGVPYFETSAKDSTGTTDAFMSMARIILGYERMTEENDDEGAAPAQKRRTIMATLGLGRWGSKEKGDRVGDKESTESKESKEKEKEKEKDGSAQADKSKDKKKKGKAKEGSMLGRIIGTAGKKDKSPPAAASAASGAPAPEDGRTSGEFSAGSKGADGGSSSNNSSGSEEGNNKEKKKWFSFT